MGGNALKAVKTVRLPACDYYPLADQICRALTLRFGGRAAAIPAFRSKPDFGDLDVLVEKEHATVDQLEWFAREVGHARQIVVNGPVLSYDHRRSPTEEVGFQVDLIRTPAAEFDIGLAYFSYNDLGNLIGRIAHKMGFSYGHRGLVYPIRSGTHLLGTVDMSSNVNRCLEFLGYDAARFHRGFEDREEIYAYVRSTRYFNPDIYLLQNRNHISRTRDRKRPTYMGFLQHLKTLPPRDYFEFPEDKGVWLPRAFAEFEGLEEQVSEVFRSYELSSRVKAVFNGEELGRLTGLSGKDLGAFMGRVKTHLGGTAGMVSLLEEGGPDLLYARALALLAPPSPRPR